MENNVKITLEEYKNLVLMAAKAELIKRYVTKFKYVSYDDLKIMLDIEETEGDTDGEL